MEKQKGKGVRDGDNGHEHCSPCSSSGAGAGVIGARHRHNLHHHVFRDPAEQVRNDGSSIGGSGLRNDRDYQPQGVELEVGEASTAEDFMYSSTVSSDQYHQQPMFEPHNHPWSTLQQPMPHLHHPSHFIDGSSTASVVSCSTTSSTAAAASSSTVMMGADNMVNNNPSREDCGSHANLAPMSLIGGAPPLPYSYGAATDYYARRAALDLQYGGYTIDPETLAQLPYCDPLTLSGFYGSTAGLSQEALFRAATAGVASGGLSLSSVTSSPFGSLQSEFSKMTAQEIMDAKALAASKSHSEAERRRRERINGHLARLRSLLPNTTKTDKASLLAEVIQHVKELKRQTSEIAEESPVPSESDELTVDVMDDGTGTSSDSNSGPGRLLVRASICCDDRSDLLPELIRALKALRLRALKAEIVTLGGRVRNVLVVTQDHESDDGAAAANPGTGGTEHDGHNQQQQQRCSVNSIQEALKAVMERATTTSATEVPDEPSSSAAGGASSGGGKRQRTNSLSSILENRSI